ncbi:MAG TPA: glutamate racemase [Chlamydiales bacterium]|jgi:glutamate racemase|nr:glutamate racemase [Chlamydiales bacterium]
MLPNTAPIGLFDSGVGGLTVMREFVNALPNENLIYLGDTARLPYGNKSPSAIVRFSLENAEFLLQKKIKLLIVSCHTACSHAFERLQKSLPIPVLGVRDPGLSDLVAATKTKRVAVLATASTISSGIFQSLLQAQDFQVFPVACPLFVPLVEEGLEGHAAAKLIAEHYLAPLRGTGIDAALLACTHYPLLTAVIQEVLGPTVRLIEPAQSLARTAFELLQQRNLLNPGTSPPTYRFFASDDPEKFRRLAKIFFPFQMDQVDLV